MPLLSVVIITKNEAKNIAACIRSAKMISDDIIVVDAESEDDTAMLAEMENVNVINLKWRGYGNARNRGAGAARYDWIFSLDADERITAAFADQLHNLFTENAGTIYGFRRRNFFNGKEIKYGALGFDKIWRLYNRNVAEWDTSPVHEKLSGSFHSKKYLQLCIDHYTIQSYLHYRNKCTHYAYLCGVKYLREGKRSTYLKRLFAAKFNFLKCYFLLFGFLDGENGLCVAKVNAYYTWLKYQHLHKLTRERQSVTITNPRHDLRFNLDSFLK